MAFDFNPIYLVWLFVARYPRSKGLDRIIDALRAVPGAQCICVGFDPGEMRRGGLGRLAQRRRSDRRHGESDVRQETQNRSHPLPRDRR